MSDAVDHYDLQRVKDDLQRQVWDLERKLEDAQRQLRTTAVENFRDVQAGISALEARVRELEVQAGDSVGQEEMSAEFEATGAHKADTP